MPNVVHSLKTRLTNLNLPFASENHTYLQEISGSLGDLGTLLPLLLSLVITRQVNLTASLFFGAITSVALSLKLTRLEIAAAGISVGGVVFLCGVTGLIKVFTKYTPEACIRGIQMGTGLTLCNTALAMAVQLPWSPWVAKWSWWDNVEIMVVAAVAAYSLQHTRRIPVALVLTVLALVAASVKLAIEGRPPLTAFGPGFIAPQAPSLAEFKRGFLEAGLAQIPLTLLNSVIAVTALAHDLLPESALNVSETSLAVSVGVMNLMSCWFSCIPYCHGSGGLAGQFRFGARTGLSIVILGFCKLALALIAGAGLEDLLGSFPKSILALLLFISGSELAYAGRIKDGKDSLVVKDSWTVSIATAALILGTKNTGLAFIAGCVLNILLWSTRNARRQQQ